MTIISAQYGFISIHALREEGDGSSQSCTARGRYFYPRPPRGGRRLCSICPPRRSRFLSTPSARRATVPVAHHYAVFFYFYPRPPRGGRR